MKKVVIHGYTHAPEVPAPKADLLDCSHEGKGCFRQKYSYEDNDHALTIKFVCKIQVLNTLKGKELSDVRQHEHRHFEDFKQIVIALKATLEKAIKAKEDLDMENRMAWFDYDLISASNAFHRTVSAPLDIILHPSSPRP